MRRAARSIVVIAAYRAFVRVYGHDDKVSVLARGADAPIDLGNVLRVHLVLVGKSLRLTELLLEHRHFGGVSGAALAIQSAIEFDDRPHRGSRYLDRGGEVQRMHAGAAGCGALGRQGVGGRPESRSERYEGDTATRALKVLWRTRKATRFAYARVDNPRLVEPAAGLVHALRPPIEGVVVGTRDHRKSHTAKIARHRRHRCVGPVAVPRIGRAVKSADVEDRRFHVAVDDRHRPQQIENGLETRQCRGVLRERTRNDEIADGRDGEPVRNVRIEFRGDRPSLVELARIPHRREALRRRD